MNIEYEEIFEKTINKDALKNLVLELEEVYDPSNGWSVGNVYKTVVDNDRIKIAVRLTKYKYEDKCGVVKFSWIWRS